jgi:hypothetical protein
LNYQSTFDTIKPLPNQTATPLLDGNSKRTDQDEQDGDALTSGNEVEMKETEASSDSDMEMSSSNGSAQSVANFIDMNVQNGVQEEPIETNPIERVRKLQTLVNSRVSLLA